MGVSTYPLAKRDLFDYGLEETRTWRLTIHSALYWWTVNALARNREPGWGLGTPSGFLPNPA
eukprot:3939463-Rhodomonas_salina.1